MKKLLLILLCLPMIGFGQEKSFELGLLFGGSLNSLKGEPEFAKKTLRPTGGFLVQYNFNNRFSIKSKLLYHIKGGRKTSLLEVEPDLGTGLAEYNHLLDLHYVTLPLLAQLNFGKNKWRFFCNTGVYLGYLIKVENIFEGEVTEVGNMEIWEKPFENYNKLDFGLMLGYGVSFQISERIKIFLESSFDHGLTNTSAIESNGIILTQAMTGTLGLTYNFPIKKKIFNGTSTLKCAEYNDNPLTTKEKKKSKWRLVLYKDGKKIGGKSKKRKSGLFRKKK